MSDVVEGMVSIITPCYCEEESVQAVWHAVRSTMQSELPDLAYEHLFVDNASTDRTLEVLLEIAATDPHVVVVSNPRNLGVHRSWMNGLHQSRGSAVVNVLADLQTPVELVPEMVRHWQSGYASVRAVRSASHAGTGRKGLNSAFYTVMHRLGRPPLVPGFMGYGLFSGPVLEFLKSINDPEPFLRGLAVEAGHRAATIYYEEPRRASGRSKGGARKDLRFIFFALITHSRFPANFALLLSVAWLLIGLPAVALSAWIASESGQPVLLWTFLAFGLWVLGGFTLALLSLLVAMSALLVEFGKNRPLALDGTLVQPGTSELT